MPLRSLPLWSARIALVAILLVLVLASLLLWQQLLSSQQQRIAERVEYQAHSLARQLESSLIEQVDGLARLAILWNYRGRVPRDEWTLDSQFYLKNFKGYQAIQWLGSDLAMRWIEPMQGNEAAQQFRLTPEHPNYPLAMRAKTTGEQSFSNSFSLVQGGRGFIIYTPLFISDEQNQRTFDGFIQGVFRVEHLMDALLSNLDSADFSASLLEAGKPIYGRELGRAVPALQQDIPLHLLNNASFSLRLMPTERLVAQLTTPLPTLVFAASLMTSLLLVAAMALAMENARRAGALQTSNRRLNEEVSQRELAEQTLRDSRERLQLVLDLTDSSRDGLFIINPQTRDILHMNRAMHGSLGYSAETFAELLKQDPEQLIPGFHGWLDSVRLAQEDKLSPIFQREMRRRDGSYQAAEINAQIMTVNQHEYLIGVSRDNKERLQVEAQLQRLSQQDGLTGLYNRRFFDNQLASEWRRLRRHNAPLTLLMLDIDYFKAYNDQLGHLAGDDVLQQVAELLKDCLQREGDVACRYGGEEFAIILANTDIQGGAHVAGHIHQQLTGLDIPHPASPIGRLTLSIGLASIEPSQENQPYMLIARSDQALYQAKHQGRNRTCEWSLDTATG
jgi:diguanylate cyclase (GGDEF)-like protein/PAS domain S-box-containing protein